MRAVKPGAIDLRSHTRGGPHADRPPSDAAPAHRHHHRRNLLVIVTVSAIALVPWIINLALTLPHRYLATDWRLTWVGFDIALLAFLSATAWLGWHRRQLVLLTAFTTGVLLCCDAWFDITTAEHHDRFTSVAAAFVEIPLAILLFRASWRLLRLAAGAPGQHQPGRLPHLDLAHAHPGPGRTGRRSLQHATGPLRRPVRPVRPARSAHPRPSRPSTESSPRLRPPGEEAQMSLRSHARFCYTHRRWVVVAWVVVFVALQVDRERGGHQLHHQLQRPQHRVDPGAEPAPGQLQGPVG